TSSLSFIEQNWDLKFIDETEALDGQGSFDCVASTVMNMFDFQGSPNKKPLILDPLTGSVVKKIVSGFPRLERAASAARVRFGRPTGPIGDLVHSGRPLYSGR